MDVCGMSTLLSSMSIDIGLDLEEDLFEQGQVFLRNILQGDRQHFFFQGKKGFRQGFPLLGHIREKRPSVLRVPRTDNQLFSFQLIQDPGDVRLIFSNPLGQIFLRDPVLFAKPVQNGPLFHRDLIRFKRVSQQLTDFPSSEVHQKAD
jgi:hypothetical protein